jgi:general secretion pathway protein D
VLRGTGRFIGPVPRRAEAEEGGGGVTLNFVNAEIAEVARAVLGGILKLNYAIDPAVKGTMTLETSRPIPRGAVLEALESALGLAGAVLVPGAGTYRIVPRAKAAGLGAPATLPGGRRGPGFTIRIVPLKFVSAGEMAKILEPLAAKGAIARIDRLRNLLVLAAPGPELRALEDMIAVFDVDWLAGLSLALVPLEFVDPEALVKEMGAVLGREKEDPLAGLLRFVPMSRLNAVLVISTQPAYLGRARAIIEELDRGGAGTDRQVLVYRVQNTDASALADTLGRVLGAGGAAPPGDLKAALAPQLTPARVDARRGGQGGTGSARSAAGAGRAPGPPSPGGARPAPAPARGLRTGGAAFTIQGAGQGAGQVRIVADRTNNAVLVWASPADYRMVASVLRKLDRVPMQVLIEATIAEVTLTDSLRYGLQWFFRSGESSLTLATAATGAVAPSFPGFSYFLDGADVKAVLDALETVTDLNVISSPQLMVLDNQTAELQVGDQVPIVTQQSQATTDSTAPIINAIEYRDTGIILRVTPRVNAGGLVSMAIEQEASLVSGDLTTEGIESPTFRQRRITSTVAVQSGETVVLGGLIQDSRDRSESGVPLLRSIPGLGLLFGSKERENTRTELLVLITPRAVANQREVRRVTEEMRRRLRAVIPLDSKIR